MTTCTSKKFLSRSLVDSKIYDWIWFTSINKLFLTNGFSHFYPSSSVPSPTGRKWGSGCVGLSCWLGLNHDSPLGLLLFPSVPAWSHRYHSAGSLQPPPSSSQALSLAQGQKATVSRFLMVQIFTAWSKVLYTYFMQEIFKYVATLHWICSIQKVSPMLATRNCENNTGLFPTQGWWIICSLILSSPVFTAGSSILCCWDCKTDEF